jgi:hypothetical protein
MQWETKLADALLAYRVSVHSTTGYSPYFLVYGRHPRLPLTKSLFHPETTFQSRMHDSAIALRDAARNTENARTGNRERLAQQVRGPEVKVGDSVIVKVNA